MSRPMYILISHPREGSYLRNVSHHSFTGLLWRLDPFQHSERVGLRIAGVIARCIAGRRVA